MKGELIDQILDATPRGRVERTLDRLLDEQDVLLATEMAVRSRSERRE